MIDTAEGGRYNKNDPEVKMKGRNAMADTADVKQILALVMVVLMGIFGNASLQEPTPAMLV